MAAPRPGPGLWAPPSRLAASPQWSPNETSARRAVGRSFGAWASYTQENGSSQPAPSHFPPGPTSRAPTLPAGSGPSSTPALDVLGAIGLVPLRSQRTTGKPRRGRALQLVFPTGRRPWASGFPRVAGRWQQGLKRALSLRPWARGWAARKLGPLLWKVGVMGARPAEAQCLGTKAPHGKPHA